MLQIQQNNLREEARKREEQEKRLKALEEKLTASTQPPPGDKNKEFWQDPMTVIRRELGEQIKPIMDIASGIQKKDEYTVVKERFKADPRFKDFMAQPGMEATVDKLMSNNPPTDAAMYSVILGIRGAQEFGEFPKPTPAPAPKPGDPPVAPGKPAYDTIPPHLRPSPPPGPEPDKTKESHRDLDENERRLCREWGMTEEEYLQWIDEEASKVPTTRIGIKEKPKS